MNVVQADPTSLQGGNPYLQGAGSPMNVYNPQQAGGLQGVQASQPQQSQQTPARTVVPQTQSVYGPSAPRPAPTAQSIQLNPIFNSAIGTRPSASNPGVLEYYNKQTGQGFSNPNDLFNFASQLGAGQVSSFDQLQAPVDQVSGQSQGYQPYQDPNQSIAQGAGNAGLSVDDLTKLAQANGAITPDQLNAIYQQLGIPDAMNSAFAPPSQSTVDLYNQAYNAAGLGDIHQQLLDLNNQIKQEQDNATNAVAGVNENPFLDEASRVGRVSVLNDKAQALIGNLTNQQTNLNNLYTQGVSEANAFVTRNTDEFNIEKTQAAAKLNSLIQMAQAQETAQEASNAQQIYRYLPDYLSNKTASNAPIGDAASGFYKYNPDTKSYEQIAGPANQFTSNPITGDLYNQATGQPATSSDYTAAFGAPPPQTGASANLPQRSNNPGDLKGANGQFAVYSTPQQGWNALVSDITAKQTGNTSTGLSGSSTLQDFANKWDPAGDGSNDPVAYAASLAKQLGVTPDTNIGSLDPQQLAVAVANNEGYFAGSTAPGTSGGNTIQQAAQQLVDGTLAPSQLTARGLSKQVVLNAANTLSIQQNGTPFDATQAETNYQNKQAVRPIINLESSAEAHLDTLLQKSNAFSRSDTPALNDITITNAEDGFGAPPAATDYVSAYNDAVGEIAKMLGGGTATDQSRSDAKSMLNPNLGPAALASQIQTVKSLMQQKLAAYTNNNNGATQPGGATPDLSNIDFSQ